MSDDRAIVLFTEFAGLVCEFAQRNAIASEEYDSTVEFVVSFGKAGEWPLFLDAFFESTIDTPQWSVRTSAG
ncbi:dioxygenase [Umezawaea sp. NPDC059074]|uniref:dioxygenase n=1 Tax=Umezawaea sp. NPDC059074 TaxID=3346716 RepID=UPI00367996A5